MDMGVREWLVVVAVILIVGILADGYRRMKAAKRRQHEFGFSLDKSPGDYNDELPNGGARVISADSLPDEMEQDDPLFMPPIRESRFSSADSAESTGSLRDNNRQKNEDFSTDESFGSALEDTIPGSLDSQSESFSSVDHYSDDPVEETVDELAEQVSNVHSDYARDSEMESIPAQTSLNLDEPVPVLMEVDGKEPVLPRTQSQRNKPQSRQSKPEPSVRSEPSAQREPSAQKEPSARAQSKPSQKPTSRTAQTTSRDAHQASDNRPERPAAQEVIIINIFARDQQGFEGSQLLQQLLANGMKFGEMSIFHRHEEFNGHGNIQFSLANGVEPGSFDLDRIADIRTPLVTLFMGLPGPSEPLKAFEIMAETAHNISQELGGDLKDESRSAMTLQTLEHCKQRIMDFERHQLTREREFNKPRT